MTPFTSGEGGPCDVKTLCGWSVVWSQRVEGSDCLSKTQVHAKTLKLRNHKMMYRVVTPARCWKVKGNCECMRSGELKSR